MNVMQSGSTHSSPEQHVGSGPGDTGAAGSPTSSVQKQPADKIGKMHERCSASLERDSSQDAAKKQKITQQA